MTQAEVDKWCDAQVEKQVGQPWDDGRREWNRGMVIAALAMHYMGNEQVSDWARRRQESEGQPA